MDTEILHEHNEHSISPDEETVNGVNMEMAQEEAARASEPAKTSGSRKKKQAASMDDLEVLTKVTVQLPLKYAKALDHARTRYGSAEKLSKVLAKALARPLEAELQFTEACYASDNGINRG